MKTILKSVALFLAAALPVASAFELLGGSLPVFLNASNLFSGFVSVVVLLTAFSEYSRAERQRFCRIRAPRGRARYPLAA